MGRLPSEVQMLTHTVLGLVVLGQLAAAWALPLLASVELAATSASRPADAEDNTTIPARD